MANTLFVVASDLHLQTRAWAKRRTLAGDSYESWRQITSYCITARAPLVLCGDIFDKSRPDPASVQAFMTGCTLMKQHSLPVYFVQGDHDYHAEVPWPTLAELAIPLHRQQVSIGGVTLYGIDWQPRERLQAELDAVPASATVLVTHQAWSELQGIGHVEGSIAAIPHAQFLFTGDYHKHQRLHVDGPHGGIQVFSPGSTCMQAIDEDPAKFFFSVDVAHDGRLEVVSHQLATRKRFDLQIDTERELQDFLASAAITTFLRSCDELPELVRKPILYVTYNDSIPDVMARLNAATGDHFHIFPNPQRPAVEVVTVNPNATPGAFNDLLTACRTLAADDQAAFDLVAAVYNSQDPAEELMLRFQRFCEERGVPVPELTK